MSRTRVGILHPGNMGISLAASAKNSGHLVHWASEGRSDETRARATRFDLVDTQSLARLCDTCLIVLSVCPPHAAEDVAKAVLGVGFKGLYLDANAISPGRAMRIGEAMAAAGVAFVDGGIIGGPAWKPDSTCLYLSGERSAAERVASCFSSGPLETRIIADEVGKASALTMCFAAYTKGSTALLCAILATSERLGVRADLERQWSRGGSDFAQRTQERVRQVTEKAWRFVGEMHEISATFREAGLPGGFHSGAADVYERIAHFKGSPEVPSLDQVLAALLADGARHG